MLGSECGFLAVTTRGNATHIESNSFDDEFAKLGVFTHILSLELEAVLLLQVVAAHRSDLVDDVRQLAFGAADTSKSVISYVAHVASSDIGTTFSGEGDNI